MVGLIDCDNFFCSCERVFRPDLARVPVVVLSNNDGCVVARSREVKAMGIKEGMPYYQLVQQYPDSGIVAFSSNYSLYGDLSARVMATLRTMVPEVVQYSIDEAFLNLDGMSVGEMRLWGVDLCRKVLRCTGIPVSLGIASTKTLAKVGSKFAKRYPAYEKCCMIGTEAQREKALKLLPVEDVWGVGRRFARTMHAAGIETAYDFSVRPRSWVNSRFHLPGVRTWQELNGESVIDIDGLECVSKKSIMTSRSFPGMLTAIEDLRTHVANYAARCAVKLRRQHSVCALLTVFVQSNFFRPDLEQYSASASFSFDTSTSTATELVGAAVQVLERIYRRGIHYKRAGVMVSGVSPDYAIQPDLFTYNAQQSDKLRQVSAALDRINSRMGADAVVLGAQQYRERGADGKSIKFVNAIRRALKSPDYTTRLGTFLVG